MRRKKLPTRVIGKKLAKRLFRGRKDKQNTGKYYWTVGEWVTHWYSLYKESKHSITTRQVQMVYINSHIIPCIGDILLHKITAADLQKFFNTLSREGNRCKLKNSNKYGGPLSTSCLEKIRSLLQSAFDAAVREGHIEKNPVRETESISVRTLKIAFFTKKQQSVFLKQTIKHRFHVAYQLLFYTGCRRSEILGLSWDCVDLERSFIRITQVLVIVNGVPVLKFYPKSKNSVRSIPLHPSLTKLLKAHKKKQDLESQISGWRNEHNLVFTNRDGSPHNPNYFLRNFKNVIKKLGFSDSLRIHSTRHTFTTNMLQIPGISIADVQRLGGWSDTRIILEVYAHTVNETQRKAVHKLYEQNHPIEKKSRKGKL
ncbi:tyrosine-type recombinase/integrase [Sporomusa sphaeroides]|uniref:Transposase from transposon Tn916 n=1 Tax=Sporomusa sphaeroides DSM 2875 TaxID=1337886 RepID=A0A1U7MAA2_9FIRM|nr:tyrosine-type recombinase/integrase [Sporomusa sphaeroides]OLS54366.1 transposase from transposon Tn916 [Sporomusa sphaeroides DSM 2875]CVK21662.1 Transposase from transposon Tn916 [Sporomusa sphaeroides DSM 2875]